MQPSMTTQALHTLIQGVLAGHTQMGAPANKLMWSLVTIEIVLIGIWAAFGEEQLAGLFKKFLGLCIWIWIVQAFPQLAQSLVESLATAALRAGGGGDNFSLMLDPSAIMARGLTATKPFKDFIDSIPTVNVGDKIAYYICYIAIVWMYIWMGFCLFYPVIEYYIFVVLGSVLMPFAINKHTRFLADKAINMVVGCGIKLMVLGFCLAIIQPVLSKIKFSNPTTWNEIAAIMLAVGSLGYLLYKAPQAAMSMVHGSPGLSGSEVLSGLGRVGVGMIASAPAAAYRAVLGTVSAGQSGLSQHNAALGPSSIGIAGAAGAAAGAAAASQPTAAGDGGAMPPFNNPSDQKGPDL
jgi:type IV secretion system protein TrbL